MLEKTHTSQSTNTESPSRTIPFLNLKKLIEPHWSEFQEAFEKVARNAKYIGGEELTSFETEFGNWVHEGFHARGCANGTDAIRLAARSLDLPRGSEAIIPAMTFIATAEALVEVGLRVRLVDVEPDTCLIDASKIEQAIGPETSLIVPVHLFGQMADMKAISQIAKKHNLKVLEDSAQAHGARRDGVCVAELGDVATYSFFPGKNLGAFGDAGAVVSRTESVVKRCYSLGHHGGVKKYQHDLVGYNSRLDNLQAAFLRIKLKYIDEWTQARRRVAELYHKELAGIDGLTLTAERENSLSAYHLFVVLVDDREGFRNFLKERGVATGVHYPKAIHEQPAFSEESFANESFPNSERYAANGVSLPMCPTLTAEEASYVCDQIREYFENF